MIFKADVTILKVEHKEGVARESKKPYSFYVASCLDDNGNVFPLNIADDFVKDKGTDLLGVKKEDVAAEIELRPVGRFGLGATLLSYE